MKTKTKKLFLSLFAFAALAITACGTNDDSGDSGTTSTSTKTSTSTSTSVPPYVPPTPPATDVTYHGTLSSGTFTGNAAVLAFNDYGSSAKAKATVTDGNKVSFTLTNNIFTHVIVVELSSGEEIAENWSNVARQTLRTSLVDNFQFALWNRPATDDPTAEKIIYGSYFATDDAENAPWGNLAVLEEETDHYSVTLSFPAGAIFKFHIAGDTWLGYDNFKNVDRKANFLRRSAENDDIVVAVGGEYTFIIDKPATGQCVDIDGSQPIVVKPYKYVGTDVGWNYSDGLDLVLDEATKAPEVYHQWSLKDYDLAADVEFKMFNEENFIGFDALDNPEANFIEGSDGNIKVTSAGAGTYDIYFKSYINYDYSISYRIGVFKHLTPSTNYSATKNGSPVVITDCRTSDDNLAVYKIELNEGNTVGFTKLDTETTLHFYHYDQDKGKEEDDGTPYVAPITGEYTFYVNTENHIYVEEPSTVNMFRLVGTFQTPVPWNYNNSTALFVSEEATSGAEKQWRLSNFAIAKDDEFKLWDRNTWIGIGNLIANEDFTTGTSGGSSDNIKAVNGGNYDIILRWYNGDTPGFSVTIERYIPANVVWSNASGDWGKLADLSGTDTLTATVDLLDGDQVIFHLLGSDWRGYSELATAGQAYFSASVPDGNLQVKTGEGGNYTFSIAKTKSETPSITVTQNSKSAVDNYSFTVNETVLAGDKVYVHAWADGLVDRDVEATITGTTVTFSLPKAYKDAGGQFCITEVSKSAESFNWNAVIRQTPNKLLSTSDTSLNWGTIFVFTDNWDWGTYNEIHVHVFKNSTKVSEQEWPGKKMVYWGQDGENKAQYAFAVDQSLYDYVVINNNNNGAQTIDTAIGAEHGFYISGGGGTGHTLGTWDIWA